MRKRHLLVLAALTLAVGMTACSNATTQTQPSSSVDQETSPLAAETIAPATDAMETENVISTEAPMEQTIPAETFAQPEFTLSNFPLATPTYYGASSDSFIVAYQNGDIVDFYSYNTNGELTGQNSYTFDTSISWSFSFMPSGYERAAILITQDSPLEDGAFVYSIYDWQCNEILSNPMGAGRINDYYVARVDDLSGDEIMVATNNDRSLVTAIINLSTGEITDSFPLSDLATTCETVIELPLTEPSPTIANMGDWLYSGFDANLGAFLVESPDSSWGYADANGNAWNMYADATYFTPSGYALATQDGLNYQLINREMEVVADNLAIGQSAHLHSNLYNWLIIEQGDMIQVVYVQ